MLKKEFISFLKAKRNLLAFSAGLDSSALFFILKDFDIDFDIAIFNYKLRDESKQELAYAKHLTSLYKKNIYIKEKSLKNFTEQDARALRYDFFKSIIKDYNYDTLITAHQLNDRLEWLFMQLSKGAGLLELLAMDGIEKEETYHIVRPLLNLTRDDILAYLNKNNIKYFVDKTNFDNKFFRNKIRNSFVNDYVKDFSKGIKNSFLYMKEDKDLFLAPVKIVKIAKLEFFLSINPRLDIYYIDKLLKKRSYILSFAQRKEISLNNSLVVSSFLIEKQEGVIFIAPFVKVKMDKKFKEYSRINKIAIKLRPYIYSIGGIHIIKDIMSKIKDLKYK